MDDEQKALRDVDRAARAELLLNDELLKEAFAYIDNELIDRWRECRDPTGRDRIWQATQLANRVQEVLKLHIRNGKVAKRILDDLEGKRSRASAA